MPATKYMILLLCAFLFSARVFSSHADPIQDGLTRRRLLGGDDDDDAGGAKSPSPLSAKRSTLTSTRSPTPASTTTPTQKSISGVPALGPSSLQRDIQVPSTFVSGGQPDPLAAPLPQPSIPSFSSSRGAAFAGQASVAQTGLGGECSTQSVSAGTAASGVQGAAQATVGGGTSGTSACGDSKEPFQLGASFFNGFVVTGSVGFQAPGQPLDCNSLTVGSGHSTTFTRGSVKTSAGGHLNGSSECTNPTAKAGK